MKAHFTQNHASHPLNLKSKAPIAILVAVVALIVIPLFSSSLASSLGKFMAPSGSAQGRNVARSLGPKQEMLRLPQEGMFGKHTAPLGLLSLLLPQGGPESIATYQPDCTTPQQSFNTGNTVCAKASGTFSGPRKIYWVNPDNAVVQVDTISEANPSSTRVVNQVGKWSVYLVDASDGSARAVAVFSVSDPQNPAADLSVVKASGDGTYTSDGFAVYSVYISNRGPDQADAVQLTESIPNNTAFIGVTQDSGAPLFTCTTGSSSTVCVGSFLDANSTASFTFVYKVNSNTPTGTVIANQADITSATQELHPEDNTFELKGVVVAGGGGGGGTCSLGCSEDLFFSANTTQNGQPDGPPGAIVHYPPPAGNDECGIVTVNHCNDCFFPVGDTVVTATATTGETCSFTVTVTPANQGATTISCPPNKTVDAGANCAAVVDPGTPTATGTNVTISGSRSDGRALNAPYPVGVTTITWTATSHDGGGGETGNASCTQTIEVTGSEDTTPPTVTAPADSSASADSNCQAPIPDYAAASTTSDDCGSTPTLTQSPEAGTLVGTGPHTVTVTATDDAGNQSSDTVVFTVNDTTAPTVTAPADSSASADANCQAPVPDYAASSTASDNCDTSVTVTQSPAAGTLVGAGPHTVTVTATDSAGNSSSDEVVFTVNDNTAPTVTAPADSSASADANCQAPVPDYAAGSTASDNCGNPTVTQSPAAGTMVGKGSHTVTVTATDAAGNSSSDTVVFTVNDTTPPVISCPANITQPTAPGSCSATVNPGTATAADNCGTVTVTGSRSDGQPLNAPYPAGTTTITWTATDGSGNQSSCTQTVTVNAPAATALGPANIWVGVKSSDDVGTRLDFLAEVYKNGTLIGSGQLNNQSSGSSGFNNAILRTIAIAQSQPASFCPGDQLSIKLSVRAGPTGHVSGNARLWYNDAAANSRFDATIDGNTNTYYLLDGFVLGTAAGPGPKKTIDVFVHRNQNGNAFKPFGTWTKTF